MSKRKVISLEELENARKKAYKKASLSGLDPSTFLSHATVRTKHPIKRAILFLFGLTSLLFCVSSALESVWWISAGLLGLSGVFFYISIWGDRCQLNECILETGETALEYVGESVVESLNV